MRKTTKKDEELVAMAQQVAQDYYDEIHHCVGCALRSKSGVIYVGINMDGIHSICAEQVAISTATVAKDTDFATIVSVGVHKDGSTQIITPCGTCRQFFVEYAPNIEVITSDGVFSLQELLPQAYQIHNR